MRKRLCIDFDGVLHDPHAPFVSVWGVSGDPIPGAIEWLNSILASEIWDVMILTARVAGEPGYRRRMVEAAILDWLRDHGVSQDQVEKITVTGEKYGAHLYIDDHGWRFDGRYPPVEELAATRAWWKDEGDEDA